ncbi:MAG: hypothetical protein J0G32_01995 [Alphaproteobacteria bacterium]|nr:hypothetical protein [Alphaproteobacteria bacterium]
MRMKKNLEKLENENLIDIILELLDSHKTIKKDIDIKLASYEDDPKKLIACIKREISGLKRSYKYIRYYEARQLSKRLYKLALYISKELIKKSPEKSVELMLEFLDLHEKTIKRVDNRDDTVAVVFKNSVEMLSEIFYEYNPPVVEVVETIYSKIIAEHQIIYVSLIVPLKNLLKEEGINILQQKLESSVKSANKALIQLSLEAIANAKKDIDLYIKALKLSGNLIDNDYLKIAGQLIEYWRTQEALEWIDKIKFPNNNIDHNEYYRIKVKALEEEGEYEQAQEILLTWFNEKFSAEIYIQILKNADQEFKEEFKNGTIEKAFAYYDTHKALRFLMEIKEFEHMAEFIKTNYKKLSGKEYEVLRPAADIIQNLDPLAATILYRKMIDSVLHASDYKYYSYTAKDLLSCKILSNEIDNWQFLEAHEDYFNRIYNNHKRKYSLWEQYNKKLETYNTKNNVKTHETEEV